MDAVTSGRATHTTFNGVGGEVIFLFDDTVVVGGVGLLSGRNVGERVLVSVMSLISLVMSASNHSRLLGPAMAVFQTRGFPFSSKLRTGESFSCKGSILVVTVGIDIRPVRSVAAHVSRWIVKA